MNRFLLPLLLTSPLTAFGCGSDNSSTKPEDEAPLVDPADFRTDFSNPFFPVVPGTVFVYEGPSGKETERVEFTITNERKTILGVSCAVIHDRVWVDGELVEDTFDWLAQHENGDVWYFGEDSREIENGEVVSTEGSWEAGVDDAEPGVLIKGTPQVGDSYRQEYYEDEAEDMAQVVRLDAAITVPYGAFTNCLQTKEWSPLEPGHSEHKYYAPGVGLVREEAAEGGTGHLDLIEIRRP